MYISSLSPNYVRYPCAGAAPSKKHIHNLRAPVLGPAPANSALCPYGQLRCTSLVIEKEVIVSKVDTIKRNFGQEPCIRLSFQY